MKMFIENVHCTEKNRLIGFCGQKTILITFTLGLWTMRVTIGVSI